MLSGGVVAKDVGQVVEELRKNINFESLSETDASQEALILDALRSALTFHQP
jgi:uncharacterized protein YqfB (UPF0267 family)